MWLDDAASKNVVCWARYASRGWLSARVGLGRGDVRDEDVAFGRGGPDP
jgi:hypothetical protein